MTVGNIFILPFDIFLSLSAHNQKTQNKSAAFGLFCPAFFCQKLSSCHYLGDNCIQNFHSGRYIVGYTIGNSVLRLRISGAVKRDF